MIHNDGEGPEARPSSARVRGRAFSVYSLFSVCQRGEEAKKHGHTPAAVFRGEKPAVVDLVGGVRSQKKKKREGRKRRE